LRGNGKIGSERGRAGGKEGMKYNPNLLAGCRDDKFAPALEGREGRRKILEENKKKRIRGDPTKKGRIGNIDRKLIWIVLQDSSQGTSCFGSSPWAFKTFFPNLAYLGQSPIRETLARKSGLTAKGHKKNPKCLEMAPTVLSYSQSHHVGGPEGRETQKKKGLNKKVRENQPSLGTRGGVRLA